MIWTWTAMDLLQSAGAPSLRPYVHVFLAYAAAWVLVGLWAWRIARTLKRLEGSSAAGSGDE